MSNINISDGSSFPRPALESDEDYGIGHKLRYGTPTRSDLLVAASVIDAYGYLVVQSTREKRDLVCREIRAALDAGEGETATPDRFGDAATVAPYPNSVTTPKEGDHGA